MRLRIGVLDLRVAVCRHRRRVRFAARGAMRASGTVLGALGLFGTETGDLNDADRLLAKTLAPIACRDPARTRPHLVHRAPATADRVEQPCRGRTGQGVSPRTPHGRRQGRVHAAAALRPHPRRTPDGRVAATAHCEGDREAILAAMRQMASNLS